MTRWFIAGLLGLGLVSAGCGSWFQSEYAEQCFAKSSAESGGDGSGNGGESSGSGEGSGKSGGSAEAGCSKTPTD